MTPEQISTIQEAIDEIDRVDDGCSCNIIKKCEDCDRRERRRNLIRSFQEIINPNEEGE